MAILSIIITRLVDLSMNLMETMPTNKFHHGQEEGVSSLLYVFVVFYELISHHSSLLECCLLALMGNQQQVWVERGKITISACIPSP